VVALLDDLRCFLREVADRGLASSLSSLSVLRGRRIKYQKNPNWQDKKIATKHRGYIGAAYERAMEEVQSQESQTPPSNRGKVLQSTMDRFTLFKQVATSSRLFLYQLPGADLNKGCQAKYVEFPDRAFRYCAVFLLEVLTPHRSLYHFAP